MGSPSSFDAAPQQRAVGPLLPRDPRVPRGTSRAVALALAVAFVSGCVTVRPEQRQFLADPSMTFGSGGQGAADLDHVLENREGSSGAATVSGGGCGCN